MVINFARSALDTACTGACCVDRLSLFGFFPPFLGVLAFYLVSFPRFFFFLGGSEEGSSELEASAAIARLTGPGKRLARETSSGRPSQSDWGAACSCGGGSKGGPRQGLLLPHEPQE